MELSDTKMLEALSVANTGHQARHVAAPNRARVQGKRLAACKSGKCGQCPTCLDHTRWERIFREKFENPDYCTARATYQQSSLAWQNRVLR
ncbi:MAG TPA: hypothetical protein VGH38_20090 [Bryobacteraceae bacterium]